MGKKFRKILATVLALSMLATFCAVPLTASAVASDGDLKFNADGKFKIVVFSDVQENTQDTHGIAKVVDMMEKAIVREQPDFVVFTGDQTEINIKDVNVDFKNLLEQLLAPVVDAEIPYGFVFGNHDSQSAVEGTRADKDAMLEVYQSIGDCRVVDADPDLFGTGTCKIPVYSSDGNSVAVDLFMVDSNTYQNGINGETGYDNPHDDQIQWVVDNKDEGAKSIVFQHIPMPQIYELFKEDASGTKTYGGKTYKLELQDGVWGTPGEFPCPSKDGVAYGEYNMLKEMGGVLGVVTGHDHLNDFSGSYGDGLTMTAVPGMTYYSYGSNDVRGYGVINLDESDLSSYEYHSVKFNTLVSEANPYAFNVDFSGGNSIEKSGNATAMANTTSGVTFKFDSTLNKTVAQFDGSTGFGYTLSDTARAKMQDGYTYEIMYKLPSVPSGGTDLASGMYSSSGFGTEFTTQRSYFDYWQSFKGDTQDGSAKPYRQLYYYDGSKVTNEWIHLVAVWDPDARGGLGQMIGYLNGTSKDTANPSTKELSFDANGEFYIGGNSASNGTFRDGTACDIAFVRIHDKVYSQSEVADLYTDAVTPGEDAVDGKYYPYDEINYSDLLLKDFPLDDEGYTLNGSNAVFSYDAKSPSYSAKLKFTWTVGTNTGVQFSFDRSGNSNDMSYPFGVWVKTANSNNAGEYGAWHLKPTDPGLLVNMTSKPNQGDRFNVELGRLKVLEGAAEHGGEYYVYLKVNDELIQETYTSADINGNYTSAGNACHLSNEIVIADWNNRGNKISEVLPPDSYDDYAELEYADLFINGSRVGEQTNLSNTVFTYNCDNETGSAVLKFRWKPTANSETQIGFDPAFNESSAPVFMYMFGVQIYKPGANANYPNGYIWLRPGYGPKAGLPKAFATGDVYDVEMGRLKVKEGANAGKYYFYFKLGDSVFLEDYIDADVVNADGTYKSSPNNTDCSISNKFFATSWGGGGSAMTAIPVPETYDDYDEVTYSDMLAGGNTLPVNGIDLGSSRNFTYNATSDSYSAVLKFRWTAGETAKFVTYFDAWSGTAYPFCLVVKNPNYGGLGATAGANGAWHVDPTKGDHKVEMTEKITAGSTHDIEFGRLKVLTGTNKGKYLVFLKVDGEDVYSYYYDGVDANGNYNDGGKLNNQIYFNSSSADNIIAPIPVPETYEDYDELEYSDLRINNNRLPSEMKPGGEVFSYNRTSPTYSAILRYRWKAVNSGGAYISFDTCGDSISYPFGAQFFSAKTDHPNGYVWIRLGYNQSANQIDLPFAIETGNYYDVEFARLKVKTGPNAGKYYVYIKIVDTADESNTFTAAAYTELGDVAADGTYTSKPQDNAVCRLSNQIKMSIWSDGGNSRVSAIPVPETYDDYDEVTYSDMLAGGSSLPVNGIDLGSSRNFTYNATSDSYSAVLKFRWTAGETAKFVVYFDAWAATAYPFCLVVKNPKYGGLGATAGENGAWHVDPTKGDHKVEMTEKITAGSTHDIEFGRLKVLTGANKGMYLVFLKVDGEDVYSYYYDGVDANGNYNNGGKLNNQIYFNSSSADNIIAPIPVPVTYEDYDEIGYGDLRLNGEELPSEIKPGDNTFTYTPVASTTYSAILRFRWKAVNKGSGWMSFDTCNGGINYPFGIQFHSSESGHPNGYIWLRIGYKQSENIVDLPFAVETGKYYNIEFARLKVKTGPNKGKYYIYFKINDILVASDYTDIGEIGADGSYVSTHQNGASCQLSNKIHMSFWSEDGLTRISAIRSNEQGITEHEGVKGDFDGNGSINAVDLTMLRMLLLGIEDLEALPEGMADFNNDGKADIRDLVAMKKFVVPANEYERASALKLGTQEHILESNGDFVDTTKTAEYIAEASAALGAGAYRLSMPIHNLYYADSANKAVMNSEGMALLKSQVAELKAKGINDILYVSASFILPYGYSNPGSNHNNTVPDPLEETDAYLDWLKVNADAFGKLAAEVPEIKFFEPGNEPNLTTARYERNGVGWNAEADEQADYKYSSKEKAAIFADLCWYVSKAVKSVDRDNQVTTPGIAVDFNSSVVEKDFVDELYKCIESGNYPSGQNVADRRPDSYFTIINIHCYPDYKSSGTPDMTNFKNNILAQYNIVKQHNDGGSRVWLSETGVTDYGERNLDRVATHMTAALNVINTELTFIDTVFVYKLADASTENHMKASETYYGLYYSGDDIDYAYLPKPIAKAVYSFFNNGSTDYSALDALAEKYAG